MKKAFYVSCTRCENWIESNTLSGRRQFSTLEKAMTWIETNVLQWYNPEDVTRDGSRMAWLVPTVGGKCIWEIEAVTIQ